jgi:hypothetical protein
MKTIPQKSQLVFTLAPKNRYDYSGNIGRSDTKKGGPVPAGPPSNSRSGPQVPWLVVLAILTEPQAPADGRPPPSDECSEEDTMARSVSRSARTGRFVTKATAARSPRTTTTERVGSGTGNSRSVNRSASTGRFVTDATVRRNPGGTITQQV